MERMVGESKQLIYSLPVVVHLVTHEAVLVLVIVLEGQDARSTSM